MCRGWDTVAEAWNSAGVPLIQGVDNMQVLFGVSNDTRVDEYRVQSAVTNWLEVATVRLGFLVNNGQGISAEHDSTKDYDVLDVQDIGFGDTIARKVYTTTVAVNNAPQHLQ